MWNLSFSLSTPPSQHNLSLHVHMFRFVSFPQDPCPHREGWHSVKTVMWCLLSQRALQESAGSRETETSRNAKHAGSRVGTRLHPATGGAAISPLLAAGWALQRCQPASTWAHCPSLLSQLLPSRPSPHPPWLPAPPSASPSPTSPLSRLLPHAIAAQSLHSGGQIPGR